MHRLISSLCFAAVIGVTVATSSACGIGLFEGTSTWCGLPLYWIFGFPVAIICAVIFGFPAQLLFRRLGLRRWWQFELGGLLFAMLFWYLSANPFTSARWIQSRFFDSLNYLGSGAAAGFAFWWLSIRRERQNAL
ncbi:MULTISPECIES: hypothetical protein [unclassified Undibacterium]|uniref:hypothetical protein n=1 Tax=unclassified Undibacterium TaxID=2630295 RepID=UPI003399C1D2